MASASAVPKQLTPWKPGQSGNPKGRTKGSRNRFAEDFIDDIHESWKILGKPAITTVAWTDPSTYLRVCASLIPKDIEITVTNQSIERMSTREIEARLRELDQESNASDPLEAEEGEDKIFRVD